jgi:hypothetical protein
MTPRLDTWQDALSWQLIDEAWPIRRDRARLIEICRRFEARYLELSAGELIAEREVEIEKAAA